MKRLLVMSLTVLCTATTAFALNGGSTCQENPILCNGSTQSVPELSPGTMLAGFALVSGAIAVLRARRQR